MFGPPLQLPNSLPCQADPTPADPQDVLSVSVQHVTPNQKQRGRKPESSHTSTIKHQLVLHWTTYRDVVHHLLVSRSWFSGIHRINRPTTHTNGRNPAGLSIGHLRWSFIWQHTVAQVGQNGLTNRYWWTKTESQQRLSWNINSDKRL